MPKLNCETIFDIIGAGEFSVSDQGPLYGPITRFEIIRDENYNLILKTVSDKQSQSTFKVPPAGTVRRADGKVIFSSKSGEAWAEGITPFNKIWKPFESRTGEGREELSRVERMGWNDKSGEVAAFTIEWLHNLPTSFSWPGTILEWDEDSEELSFCSTRYEIGRSFDERIKDSPMGMHNCCVYLNISGLNLFFGFSPSRTKESTNPGFILYEGLPDEDVRLKIRNALSFMTGRYLIYLGETQYNKNWNAISALCVRGNTLNNSAFILAGSPPALLDFNYRNIICSEILQKSVVGILNIYDDYDLGPIFWNYWYAMSSPIHMTAVNFGAIFERLQYSYYEISPSASKKIIKKSDWSILAGLLRSALDSVDLSISEKAVLMNKINNLNVKPQNLLMKDFLLAVGLNIGLIEQNAWKSGRNRAAHGGKINLDEYGEIIKENHVFQTLINRLILAISGASNHYIDYFSLDHPPHPISLGIQQQE